ncbi:bifunctional DNA primase/polymerase [Streptosporangium sandarakinum]|uniref:bifunctional DNA primase/polymerase n=1 Tax=Streptosporangium sandarakinum TaxID=1260955 RepID=UPI0036BC3C49
MTQDLTHQLEWATWLQSLGLHLIALDHPGLPRCIGPKPCDGKRGKHPVGAWSRNATNDPDTLRATFSKGLRNIGIACKPSGLLVVDEDAPGALQGYADSIGETIPATFTVETGRPEGGTHYYFRAPEGVQLGNSKGALNGLDIDIRGPGKDDKDQGGYVVAPGSIHETGVIYTPKDPNAPILPAPEWLVQALTAGTQETPAASPLPFSQPPRAFSPNGLAPFVEDELSRHTGDRSNDFARVAGACKRAGYSPEQTAEILISRNHPGVQKYEAQGSNALREVHRVWPKLSERRAPAAHDHRDPSDLIAPTAGLATDGNLATVHQLPNTDQDADAEPRRKVVLTPASAIKPRRVRWLWEGRIALGSLSLLAGGEGLGKSTLGYTIAADVTRGALPGEYNGEPRAILVCASEDSWEYTIVPRLMAADADLDRVFRIEVQTADDLMVGLSLPRDLIQVENAAKEVGAAMMILDPLMSRMSESIDTHKDGDVRRALEPLVAVADRAGMAILGLIHHNKSGSSDPLQLVMASKAFTAVARSVHSVIKDPDDESEMRRLFGTPKNNLGRTDLPTLAFTIVGHQIDTEEGPTSTGRLVWAGEVEGTIGDAMKRAQSSEEDRSAGSEAADWLLDYLTSKGGTDDSATIKKEGAKAGHSHDALKRARKRIKAEYSQSGFPRRTYWTLPGTAGASTPGPHPFTQPSPVGAPIGATPRGDTPTAPTAPTEGQSAQSVQSERSEQATNTPHPPTAPTKLPRGKCEECGQPMTLLAPDQTRHPLCEKDD